MISEKLSTDSRRMLQKGVPQFVGFCRCTPCRQRRGKGLSSASACSLYTDAPRAGSAEAKMACPRMASARMRCTPCRQRRGKDPSNTAHYALNRMHPVQAAPRQSLAMRSYSPYTARMHPVQAAPRQRFTSYCVSRSPVMHPVQAAPRQRSWVQSTPIRGSDAPRAGSAEAKSVACVTSALASRMHPVQAAHSEITTCRPMVL